MVAGRSSPPTIQGIYCVRPPTRPGLGKIWSGSLFEPSSGRRSGVNVAPVTESQLADEVARFRLIAAHVPAWIALYNADDNRCIYANRAYAEAFGLTEQSVLGLTYWQVIGDAAQAEISQMVQRLRAGETTRYERHLQTADGRWVWIEGHLIPQFDAQGRVIAGCVMMNDITHFREAQRIAAETETRLQKFLDATVEGHRLPRRRHHHRRQSAAVRAGGLCARRGRRAPDARLRARGRAPQGGRRDPQWRRDAL